MSQPRKKESRAQTLLFVAVLCLVCGFILSFLATALKKPQERAIQLNQIKELLIAAKLIDPKKLPPPTELFTLYNKRVKPLFTDKSGAIYNPNKLNIDVSDYIANHQKKGFSHLKYKLFYRISSEKSDSLYACVIPVNGFGLWDAIYGYIAIGKDGKSVLGTTWYDQKETPGLGAEIESQSWQKQFFDKIIFQSSGAINMAKDPIGIVVVKGKVSEILGTSPLSESAVDGLPGATLTGEGVTQAYRSSLTPYRALFEKIAKGGL